MFSQAVQEAMNNQINAELYSAYIYLSMTAHFEKENLPGMAHWMKLQAEEEVEHAMKFFNYIHERGGSVTLKTIDQPPVEWGTPLEIFEAALAHEKKVTAMINNIYEIALEEKDYPSQIMLQWFIEEQVEEEENSGNVVDMLGMAGDNVATLFMIDKRLGAREDE